MELYVALYENNLESRCRPARTAETSATRLRRPGPDRSVAGGTGQGNAPGVADTFGCRLEDGGHGAGGLRAIRQDWRSASGHYANIPVTMRDLGSQHLGTSY